MTLLLIIKIKSNLINYEPIDQNGLTETIKIHFTHGSINPRDCFNGYSRLGGLLGGHVEVEIDSTIYGFIYDALPVEVFPDDDINSKIENINLPEWEKQTKEFRVTTISLEITSEQKNSLEKRLNANLLIPKYDYSFFGQRCTSFLAYILGKEKIINPMSKFESSITYFYPRQFRHTLLKFALTHNYDVEFRKGIECVIWE
ncbi:MAG: hypothetical protein HKO66_05330 [Saprospiraceae bacterium]|nr:hypothetical protein [Bacteroidia bacterium]NNE15452.1 hypothetical protein [Saprospiraceae bacterium]NNL91630.1 hypothetical protein [Saprospiraceae bacterium]